MASLDTTTKSPSALREELGAALAKLGAAAAELDEAWGALLGAWSDPRPDAKCAWGPIPPKES